MRIVDELDSPISTDERAELVNHLLSMIDHWNAGIARHKGYAERDAVMIAEFTERRDDYVQQLAKLLQRYGLNFQPGLPWPGTGSGHAGPGHEWQHQAA